MYHSFPTSSAQSTDDESKGETFKTVINSSIQTNLDPTEPYKFQPQFQLV